MTDDYNIIKKKMNGMRFRNNIGKMCDSQWKSILI